jgi:hypothetical protein
MECCNYVTEKNNAIEKCCKNASVIPVLKSKSVNSSYAVKLDYSRDTASFNIL